MTQPDHTCARPRDWDSAVSAAFFVAQGSTLKAASEAVGVDRTTVHRWARSDWWPEAMREARDRWLKGLDAKVRAALSRILDADEPDPATVRWAAERLWPEFSAPAQRVEIGATAEVKVDHGAILLQRLLAVKAGAEAERQAIESEAEAARALPPPGWRPREIESDDEPKEDDDA